jgi:hypothetical protein
LVPAEVLLHVAEADLDRPAGGVAGGDLLGGRVEVGGEEVVVGFVAVGVADDD